MTGRPDHLRHGYGGPPKPWATAEGRPLRWMIATSVVSWIIVAGLAGGRANPEVLYGMVGPLAAAAASWVITKRTYTASPDRLMGVLITGMAIKAVFFGVYVVIMLRVMALRPAPFVFSFTAYFITLYAMEALFMRRLFERAN
jgi:hypothetical protein